MLFGLAEIGIAPPGKKDWKVTLAEGKRRQKTAVERFSSACAGTRTKPIVADESETVRPYIAWETLIVLAGPEDPRQHQANRHNQY